MTGSACRSELAQNACALGRGAGSLLPWPEALLVSRQRRVLPSSPGKTGCRWNRPLALCPKWGPQTEAGMGPLRTGALKVLGGAPFPSDAGRHCLPGQNGLPWYFQTAQLFICVRNSMPMLSQFACSLSEACLM